jgi:hypothetical protein
MHLAPRNLLRSGINTVRRAAGAAPLAEDELSVRHELKQAGQIVVIFAVMLTVLIGLVGIAIDTTYAWREALRVQRAADAAALAGVVYMPGNATMARSTASTAAARNGFSAGSGTSISFPATVNQRQLDVTITTPVPTFFSRIFGVNHFDVSRTAKAVYVLPVPMGSPLAFYGTYQLTSKAGVVAAQPGAPGVPLTENLGFFGAIEGMGSNRSTGDAYAPYYNGNPTVNAGYNPDGYRYEIQAAAAGTLYIFDPMFCATIKKDNGAGYSGTGDHWLGKATPVTTHFVLWDTHNVPLAPATWTVAGRIDETNQNAVDKGALYGNNGSNDYSGYVDGGAANAPVNPVDCKSNSHHNNWVAIGNVAAGGTYSLQVTTSGANTDLTQNFENMFSLAVSGGGRIYGSGSMVSYANIDNGSSNFYLAQIDRTAGAGKTVQIELFDPGDTNEKSWIQILPDGTPAWQPINFSYSADNGRANGNTNCIQTNSGAAGAGTVPNLCGENAGGGGNLYNNSWITINVSLPTTYGDAAHPLSNNGWWKIRYQVGKGNDTTTWRVTIKGNPVHLIP